MGHDRALPDLGDTTGMRMQKAEGAPPSAYRDKEVRRIKELGLDPVDSIRHKTDFSRSGAAACRTGRASEPS
jgi:agmatinase